MRFFTLLPTILLLTLPVAARADYNPDFDDDAKPILRLQPGLLKYVEAHFKVKDTGAAKYPGTDDRPPQPPFMFRAKPRGEPGPYHLMLLIQPGPMNRILNVVDMDRVHPGRPLQTAPSSAPATLSAPANQPAVNAQSPITQTPASSQPTLTSDTPSGPIKVSPTNQPSATAPSLEPPPDPAPTAH